MAGFFMGERKDRGAQLRVEKRRQTGKLHLRYGREQLGTSV